MEEMKLLLKEYKTSDLMVWVHKLLNEQVGKSG